MVTTFLALAYMGTTGFISSVIFLWRSRQDGANFNVELVADIFVGGFLVGWIYLPVQSIVSIGQLVGRFVSYVMSICIYL